MSVVRGSAARRRGPPSDPAGSTGLALRDEPSTRGVSGPGDPDARLSLPAPSPIFWVFGPIFFFRATGQKSHQSKMFYTMTVAFALLCAANGAQSDGDLLAQKRPHNPANAATDLVRELMATHGATPDYDLVADPAALVHVQPKDAVVADVDGASPAPKDRKIPRAFYFVSSPRPQATATTTWSETS